MIPEFGDSHQAQDEEEDFVVNITCSTFRISMMNFGLFHLFYLFPLQSGLRTGNKP